LYFFILGLISSSSRDCFIEDVSLHSTGLISYRREIDLVSLYSWFDFIIFERLIYEDVSYSLDVRYFMAWFGLLHPPSIFTLFASPVEVLRRRRCLSLRMLFL